MQHAADSKHCAACGAALDYDYYLFGHLGGYHCPGCGAARPEPTCRGPASRCWGWRAPGAPSASPAGRPEISHSAPRALQRLQHPRGHDRLARPRRRAGRRSSAQSRISPRLSAGSSGSGRRPRHSDDPAKNPAGFNEVIRTLTSAPGKKTSSSRSTTTSPTGATSPGYGTSTSRCSRAGSPTWCARASAPRTWPCESSTRSWARMSLAIEPDLAKALDAGLASVAGRAAPSTSFPPTPRCSTCADHGRARARRSVLGGLEVTVRIGWLYPDLMNIYGDRGNIVTLVQRCQWRGIPVEVEGSRPVMRS